jgi:replication factor A2
MDYQGDMNAGGFGTGGDAYNVASSQGGASSGGGGRRNYDEQTVLPVTARMVLMARGDPGDSATLRLEDDRKIHRIKLVGAIRSIEEGSTNVVYQIEDGTGLVEVKQWLDDNDCMAQQELRQATNAEHIYVKIIGQVKEFNGTRTIMASSIRPLNTGNELAHHFLEVVYSGERYKNKSTIVQPGSPMMGISNTNNMGGVGFSGGGMRTPMVAQGGGNSGDALKDTILAMIQNEGGTFGGSD